MGNVLPWRNAGETTNFPFSEAASLISNSQRNLPADFLVDAQIFVPAYLGTTAYLSALRISGSKVLGTISAENGVLGTFEASAATINDGFATITAASGAARGTVVFGSQATSVFRNLRLGDNSFTIEAAPFESSCTFSMPGNILHEIVATTAAVGRVALVEGVGVVLVKEGPSQVRLDAVGSAGPLEDCCEDPGVAIKSINGAVPNQYGNITFNLEPFSEPSGPEDNRQVLRLRQIANGLEFFLSAAS